MIQNYVVIVHDINWMPLAPVTLVTTALLGTHGYHIIVIVNHDIVFTRAEIVWNQWHVLSSRRFELLRPDIKLVTIVHVTSHVSCRRPGHPLFTKLCTSDVSRE